MPSRNFSTDNARVYVDWDVLPLREPGWTRFVCISDTHSATKGNSIPEGDVLLHAGDLSSYGYPAQLQKTLNWLAGLSHPLKLIIAGNHDLCLDKTLSDADQALLAEGGYSLDAIRASMKGESLRSAGIYYLEHEVMTFQAPSGKIWNVYGSPAAPRYARGSFQYKTPREAEDIYRRIPECTDILLTHTPPHSVLDRTRKGKLAGCRVLEKIMGSTKHARCRLHVFGHIHEARGALAIPSGVERRDHRIAVNAAVAAHGAKAVVVDLKE